jgi:hypothetical protein
MSNSAAELIDAFSALPADERHSVLIELARIAQSDIGPLTDAE